MSALEDYSGGYPYLRIARYYGVDYDMVLSYADYWSRAKYNDHDTAPPTYWEAAALAKIASFGRAVACAIRTEVFATISDFDHQRRIGMPS